MWRVNTIETRDRVLDFSSSGQGRLETQAILADGVAIINAASLLDLDTPDEHVQVRVCEECGFSHCESGGWIALRRVGTSVLWIPCFELMADPDGTGAREYAPPRFPTGLPLFPPDQYEVLRQLAPGFPALDAVPLLRSRAAVRLLQSEAPGRVLGRFPETPRLDRRDLFIASEPDELSDATAKLEALIENAWAADEAVQLGEGSTPVTFYLDLPGTPAWTPFARTSLSLAVHSDARQPNSGFSALPLTWPSLSSVPRR
jgi:hypothetical protein